MIACRILVNKSNGSGLFFLYPSQYHLEESFRNTNSMFFTDDSGESFAIVTIYSYLIRFV